jgi:hypothetical protein
MSSKQLNFFVTPADWENIDTFFKRQEIVYVKNRLVDKSDFKYNSFFGENKSPHQIFFTNVGYTSNIFFHFDEVRKDYYPDRLKSYLVEFDLGGFNQADEKALHRGRFYYAKSYFATNGETIEKQKKFTDWADKIIKSFEKEFLRKIESEKFIYFSESALMLLENKSGTMDKPGLKIILRNKIW